MKTKLCATVVLILAQLVCLNRAHAGGLVAAWGDDSTGQTTLPVEVNNVKAIAAGYYHTVALKSDGTVVSWGIDNIGQTDVPEGLSNVVAVAASLWSSLALKSDGTVVAWGAEYPPTGLSNVIAIAEGDYHTLALKSDGTVVTWGYNNYAGQMDVPAGLANVIAIAAGGENSLALKSDGTVVAWGANGTNVPTGLSNVVAISTGTFDSLALKVDGSVVAWGGQTNMPADLSNVVAISAGYSQNLALKADGTVVAWGSDIYGEGSVPVGLSNATAIAASVYHNLAIVFSGPVQITQNPQSQVVAYPSNATFSVSATGAGTLNFQWFLNGQSITNNARVSGATTAALTIANAQITDAGTYTVVVSNAFGSVISDGAVLNVTNAPPVIVSQPTSGSVPIGADFMFTVSALGSPPLTYQWRFNGQDLPGATNTVLTLTNLNVNQTGYYEVVVSNPFGTAVSAKVWLGVGQTSVQVWSQYSSPYALTNVPPGLTNAVAVAAGPEHILVLKRDGTILDWGVSQQYPYSSAVFDVPSSADDSIAIAASYTSYGGYNNLNDSSMALKANGTAVVWAETPYLTMTNLPVPAAATNVVAIADGGDHYVALKSDGTVFAWSLPAFGYTAPAGITNPPPGLSNVVAVAGGQSFSLALRNDGTVVGWGSSGTSLETNIPAGLSNLIAISASWGGTCMALKADGTVTNWGYSGGPVSGLSNVVAISAGISGAAALKSDGTVLTWGSYGNNFPSGISNVIALACGGGGGYPGISPPPFLAYIVGDGSPFVTIQPASQTVIDGATVQFHARAVGVQPLGFNQRQQNTPQPLSYQWQFNGLNISGATNDDFIITNVTAADAGNYQAVVTNYLGAVTSKVAQLTVVVAPYGGTLAAALNATNLIWNSSSTNAPWFAEISITHDDEAAAQSGHIGDSQQSILQTTVTGPGTLAFWWKVSSEEDFDFLEFFIDSTNAAAISGEADWQQLTFAIPSGVHTLKWIYAKDPSVSVGQDAGWLDEVSFTPPAPQQLIAPAFLSDGSFSFIASNAADKFLQPADVGSFEIQASTDLVNWVTLTNPLALTNGALQWRDAASTNYPTRFYRLMEH